MSDDLHPRSLYGLLHRFRHRHLLLFGVLLSFLLTLPLVDEGWIPPALASLVFIFVVVPSVYATGQNARMIWLGILLASPSIGSAFWSLLASASGSAQPNPMVNLVSMICFLGFTVVAMTHHLLRSKDVNEELLASAVGVYLVAGYLFAAVYGLIWLMEGPCIEGMLVDDGRLPSLSQFVYFSLMTQTTVGFGDMYPTTSWVRVFVSFQAVLGQVFLVVLIAQLVSVYASTSRPTVRSD